MGGHLYLVITDQGHVEEICFSSESSKGLGDSGLEIIPLELEFV